MNEFKSIKPRMNDSLTGSWHKLLDQIRGDSVALHEYLESYCYDIIQQQVWIQVWGPMYDELRELVLDERIQNN